MAPRPLPWWRFYTEFVDDPKMRRRPPIDNWILCVIFTFGRESIVPGTLLLALGMPVTLEDVAHRSRVPLEEVEDFVAYAIGPPKILRWEGDTLTIVNWNRRQYESDRRTKGERIDDEGDVDTTTKRGPSSVSVSVIAFEDQEISVDEAFDRFWDVAAVKSGKKKAREAFELALKRAPLEAIIAGMIRYRDWTHEHPDHTVKYPQGWLNDDRWTDDLSASGNGQRPGREPTWRRTRAQMTGGETDERR